MAIGGSDSEATSPAVTISMPARLHFGFLDINGGLGRRFGSLGLGIGQIRTRLSLRAAERDSASGPQAERAGRYLAELRAALGLRGALALTVEDAIPEHAGLGSGTQMALGVSAVLRRLHGLPMAPEEDALRLRRGERSGIGIGLFARGGFIVDGGNGETPRAPPVLARLLFPRAWRVILLMAPSVRGVHGPDELAAFRDLPPFPASAAAHICRLTLLKILPALAECDLPRFGAGIAEVQAITGDHFAPAQGGRFASPAVAAALNALTRLGAHGPGQSSWGPTGFAFAPSEGEALRLSDALRGDPVSRGLDIKHCQGLNHGMSDAV